MTNESDPPIFLPSKGDIGSKLYIATVYLFSVASLYQLGYWAPFRFNIFPYMTVADVFRYSALPLAVFGIGYIVVALMIEVLIGEAKLQQPGRIMRFAARQSATHRLGRRLLFLIAIAASIAWGGILKWFFVGALLGLAATKWLIPFSWFAKQFEGRLVQLKAGVFLALFVAFGLGYTRGSYIIDGTNFQYLTSPIEGMPFNNNLAPALRPRLIGYVGNHYFFMRPGTHEISVINGDIVKVLHLDTYREGDRADPVQAPPASASSPQYQNSSAQGSARYASQPIQTAASAAAGVH